MESYLSMSQAKAQKDDFQNWLGVLKELDHIHRDRKRMEEKNQGLQTQIEKLKISLEKVQEANKTLREEVAVLKEKIERLKSLDRQIEERRRLTR
jgi:peptidoglycan hydrolase CwlO-like protein